MSRKYVTENEIALHDKYNAQRMAEILMEEGYVVMMSREEQLYILNYVWSENNSNRNDVVFNHREIIEDIIFDTESEDE